jgi:acetyl esterase/lipase
LLLLAAVPALALLLPAPGRADYVFLHDGFTLHGQVQREGTIHQDPSGQTLWIPKLGSFYLVDDYARKVVFSERQVSEARPDPANRRVLESYSLRPALFRHPGVPIIQSIRMERAERWEPNGERAVTFTTTTRSGLTRLTYTQCISNITPHRVRVDARGCHWTCSILTSEFAPDDLLPIIRRHLEQKGTDTLERHFSIFRFCVQAGWYEEAEAELKAIAETFPGEKDKLEQPRKELRQLQAGRALDDLERALRAGQFDKARQVLAGFPEEEATPAVRNKVRGLRRRLAEQQADLDATRKLLAAVRQQAAAPPGQHPFDPALAEIEAALNLDTCGRLEPFLTLARQEERHRAQGRKPDLEPDQLLALAVSGWIMGPAGAENQPRSAAQLWQARVFLREYLRTRDAQRREQLLAAYQKGEARRFDEIVQLIELLPPPLAERAPPKDAAEMTTLPEPGAEAVKYRLQLPPEYHHHRAYPVLLLLHNTAESPKEAMSPWAELAAKYGYLLAAPEWGSLLQDRYRYTEKEHEAVVAVLLDLRRRFHVDSERIFIAGFGEGGNFAYDLGLRKPSLFAGVVVMCGQPGPNFSACKNNAQYLPFYVIDGDKNGKSPDLNRGAFKQWIPRNFPSLYVEYEGRGYEFFRGELPYVFDWLNRKKRAKGLPDLGRPDPSAPALGQEFVALKPSDNRFYWLTLNDTDALRLSARIAASNFIIVQATNPPRGLRLTAGMVDFEQPVTVRVLPAGHEFKRVLKPSLAVLLEDFYLRGDKRNLYVAKVDYPW